MAAIIPAVEASSARCGTPYQRWERVLPLLLSCPRKRVALENGTDKSLVEAIHSLFAQHFNRAVHWDILFLKPKQEDQLDAVLRVVLPAKRNELGHCS
jgi:hypothetical protein